MKPCSFLNRLFVFFGVFSISLPLWAQPTPPMNSSPEATTLAVRIQTEFQRLNSLQGVFTKELRQRNGKTLATGTFAAVSETTGPKFSMIFDDKPEHSELLNYVCDGKTIWVFDFAKKTADEATVTEDNIPVALRLLLPQAKDVSKNKKNSLDSFFVQTPQGSDYPDGFKLEKPSNKALKLIFKTKQQGILYLILVVQDQTTSISLQNLLIRYPNGWNLFSFDKSEKNNNVDGNRFQKPPGISFRRSNFSQ